MLNTPENADVDFLTKLMDSCANLKTNGMVASGNYILNDQSVVFCEMSKQISDSSLQQHIGNLHYNDVV